MFKPVRKIYAPFLIVLLVLIGSNGCKDEYNSVIPYVTVRMDINPTNFIELNIPGGSYYFPNYGYGGVIIFRDLTDSSNPFLAYDATCTYEISTTTRVVANESGIATCPTCKSQFILFGGNGNPIKGPAIEPLRQYRTNYASGRIIVTN